MLPKQLLHHPLFDSLDFGEAGFFGGDFGIHIGDDGGSAPCSSFKIGNACSILSIVAAFKLGIPEASLYEYQLIKLNL